MCWANNVKDYNERQSSCSLLLGKNNKSSEALECLQMCFTKDEWERLILFSFSSLWSKRKSLSKSYFLLCTDPFIVVSSQWFYDLIRHFYTLRSDPLARRESWAGRGKPSSNTSVAFASRSPGSAVWAKYTLASAKWSTHSHYLDICGELS